METECTPSGERRALKKLGFPLVALNIFLVVLALGTIAGAAAFFQRSAYAAVMDENVFLTVEWRLLRELKERTDQLLLDKDRQIDELRRRYLGAGGQSGDSGLPAAIRAELARLESERDAIIASRFAPAQASMLPPAGADESPAVSQRTRQDGAVAELLRDRILALEVDIAEERRAAFSSALELAALRAELAGAIARLADARGPDPASGASDAQTRQHVPAHTDAIAALQRLLSGNRDGIAAQGAALTLEDIRTRTLLRAIVRTQAIRDEYPDLAASLDRYFRVYAEDERRKGRLEAYDDIGLAIRELMGL